MKSLTRVVLATLLVGGLASVALAWPGAGPGERGGRGGRGMHLERMLDDADLTPETADRVRSIFEQSREAHRPMRKLIREAQAKLHDLLDADEPDAAAVIAQADEVGNLIGQAQRMRVSTLLQVRSVVTAEEWHELRQVFEDGFGPGHGRGRCGDDN